MNKRATILVVDDENGIRQSFNVALKDDYDILLAATGDEAVEVFTRNRIDVVLLDILLPDASGIELLERFKTMDPNTEIIMVTAVKDIQTAVKAIKLGAYEYIIKPFIVSDVINIIGRALEKHSLLKEVTYLRNALERYQPFGNIVGEDKKMKDIFDMISTISDSEGAVLIQGESGTGKELVARAIHNLSSRREEPFVVVNCAAIPSTLMESEIFGHDKGSFTGAVRTHMGRLEIADKGTVFLDDIDTLDINMQAKLLRVIQEKEFERLGSVKVIRIDSRFIAAANRDITELIREGKFREDLFYRLNVFPIRMPPLRERKKDIPLLLDYFLEQHARKTGRSLKRFSKDAIDRLMKYSWPGNVRELQNIVERFFTISKKAVIHLKDMSTFHSKGDETKDMTLKEAINSFEKRYIREILDSVNGNRKEAAEMLGIHRNTLLGKINELGLKQHGKTTGHMFS